MTDTVEFGPQQFERSFFNGGIAMRTEAGIWVGRLVDLKLYEAGVVEKAGVIAEQLRGAKVRPSELQILETDLNSRKLELQGMAGNQKAKDLAEIIASSSNYLRLQVAPVKPEANDASFAHGHAHSTGPSAGTVGDRDKPGMTLPDEAVAAAQGHVHPPSEQAKTGPFYL